jgi:hypothetical protein
MRRDRPKAPTVIHSPSGLKFLPLKKANLIADCLENHFSPHYLREENHERQVVASIQALLEAVDDDPPERLRSWDVQKIKKKLSQIKKRIWNCHSKRMS